MHKTPNELLQDALELPDDQRATLACQWLASLDQHVPPQGRSEEAWVTEVQRRARAALAGTPGLSWDQALAQIMARLDGK